MPAPVTTSVDTADGSVTTGPGRVWGILVAAGATGGAWQLNDSTDDSGTDLISGVAPANSGYFIDLSTIPVEFATAIYADIPGTNVTLTTFYT